MAGALWPRRDAMALLRFAALAIAGTIALTLAAKTKVPFYPVPMTLQSMVVLILGAAYGFRLGVATLLLYIGEGLAGLPVFAGAGAGPLYMAGPTGGYLAGFLLAVAIIGALAERGWDRSWPQLLAAMVLGQAAVYALGLGWLSQLIGSEKAVAGGFLPFYLADGFKTLLACALVIAAWKGVERLRGASAL